MVYWIILASMLTFFILFSLFIPLNWKVRHTALIKIPVEELYHFLLHVKNWPQWQLKDEGELTFLYVGPKKGEGATQYWETGGVPASLRIVKCEHLKSIHYQIRINQGETVLRWTLEFKSDRDFTYLTWMCQGTAKKNPFERYFTLFYKWKTKQEMNEAMERLQKMNTRLKSIIKSA